MDVSVDVAVAADTNPTPVDTTFFIGFRYAFHIIERFLWKVNGTDIQTEINYHQFGTLHNLCVSQEVREKNPFTYTNSTVLTTRTKVANVAHF